MDKGEAIVRFRTKLECMEKCFMGDSMCNECRCDVCNLGDSQGTLEMQLEYLHMALEALEKGIG